MRRSLTVTLALLIVLSFIPALALGLQSRAGANPAAAANAARNNTTPQDNGAPLVGFDEFVSSVMSEWKIPGLAIAVIKDDQVILSKGYGYRDLENKQPVTARTLFAIGSITKSFTVSALGMLADDGKLEWDKPVRAYLPDFDLHDRVATQLMTPRDLVTHRSGLPRHDALWYGASLNRKQMYERLRHLEPSKDFRSTFQYNNLMFLTAGILGSQISGMEWEDLIRKRVFQPLGMSNSNFSVNDSQKSDDFAFPYTRVKDEVKRVPFRNIDQVGPAGSINSSVEEMIRYVQLHINNGKSGDTQILSAANAEQMQMPQMVIPGSSEYEELGHASYGMGFLISSYRGNKLVEHGGGIDGFISLLSFMPRKKIGMIILTNLSGNNPVNSIIIRNVYDRLLGLNHVDWVARVKEQQAKAKKAEEESKKKNYTPRKEGTSPSHALADYTGRYEHPAYGTVNVEVDAGELKIKFNSLSGRLKHFHYDIFEVPEDPTNPLQGAKITFSYNKKGDIDRVAVPLESSVGDIVFTRVADEAMTQKDFLEPLVGEYTLGTMTASVSLKETTLTLTVPGQPTYELVPTRGTSFDLKGLSGFSVEFKKDTSGLVVEMVVYQPNGTFVARRK